MTFWNNIDETPLKTWRLFHEKKDLRYFQKTFEKDQDLTEDHLLSWFSICDQIQERYGHNDKYIDYLDKKKKYAMKMADYLVTGDRFNINKVNLSRIDMEEVINDSDGIEIREAIIAIQKYMGFASGINENTLTISDYHDYIESMTTQYGKAS